MRIPDVLNGRGQNFSSGDSGTELVPLKGSEYSEGPTRGPEIGQPTHLLRREFGSTVNDNGQMVKWLKGRIAIRTNS